MKPAKDDVVIELRNVKKIYAMGEGEVHALDGISLKIFKNDFVSIMGPSGSGKSTLMGLVGCLDYPSEGQIFLDGHDVTKLNESDLAVIRGRKIGFIFQKFFLIPSLTALENVMIPLVFQNVPIRGREEIARNFLKKVGLEDRLDFKPNELSGGQQQRVAIARALAVNPEVILADEPTGNLDSKTGELIMDLIQELHERDGKTVILVTHDVNIGKRADRIIRLKDGKVVSV